MTNTPMTSREAFEKAFKNHKLDTFHPNGYPEQWEYKYKYVQHAWEGWQACEQQQAQTIAELVEALESLKGMQIVEQEEIIDKALAKVKGTTP